ncbi:MAG: hypothetical protein J5477_04075 [Schwartzia sp.]|nr:hypothetical protein [Schwartzia sp. (in: firmicutes)]
MKAWMIGVLAAVLFGTGVGTSICFAEEPSLVICSYYSGGGMSGGHLYMRIKKQQDGTVMAMLDSQLENGAPKVHRETEAPQEKLYELAAMFNRDDLVQWSKAPRSEIEALDADRVSVGFHFSDGSEVMLHDSYAMPREAFAAMTKVNTFLWELLKDAPEVEIKGNDE